MTDAPQEHVMLDLETLGNGPRSAIMSIGAVKFTADKIIDRFYAAIELSSNDRYKLETDGSTLEWWLHPDRHAARQRWIDDEKLDLGVALDGFLLWVGENKPIWGNGSTFDNVILRNAYARAGLDYPAKFWNDHCYRTMKTYCPGVAIERVGVHHYAVDDAESQALHLQRIAKEYGVKL